jgi:hypothetical protein
MGGKKETTNPKPCPIMHDLSLSFSFFLFLFLFLLFFLLSYAYSFLLFCVCVFFLASIERMQKLHLGEKQVVYKDRQVQMLAAQKELDVAVSEAAKFDAACETVRLSLASLQPLRDACQGALPNDHVGRGWKIISWTLLSFYSQKA